MSNLLSSPVMILIVAPMHVYFSLLGKGSFYNAMRYIDAIVMIVLVF